MIVIITIVSCAELRKKRVNLFILNLAVGDLMIFFLSLPRDVALAVVGHWTLGNVACKLLIYGYIVAVVFTIFLLTAISIDRYQVSDNSLEESLANAKVSARQACWSKAYFDVKLALKVILGHSFCNRLQADNG